METWASPGHMRGGDTPILRGQSTICNEIHRCTHKTPLSNLHATPSYLHSLTLLSASGCVSIYDGCVPMVGMFLLCLELPPS